MWTDVHDNPIALSNARRAEGRGYLDRRAAHQVAEVL